MGRLRCDDDGRPVTCRMLASAAPPIQGKNQLMWIIWGGGDKREGQFGGIEHQERVKVKLIKWRSIDFHSINSKSTFCPPQSGKRMGTYSACVLGVRLRYQRHGKHIVCCRHLCHCQDEVIAIVDVKGSLPSLLQLGHCRHQCGGFFAVVELASSPSLQWCCHRQCAGVFAVQESLPLLQ
jgi:hypothetical protein